uniref:C2H2-type domain-containing protein n=1 Tax=Ditylenchus dipsaci TaxID=166011 RepID=A0A915DK50_9BILA
MSSTTAPIPAVDLPSKIAKKTKSVKKSISNPINAMQETHKRQGLVPILPKLAPRSSLSNMAAPEILGMDVLGQCMKEFLMDTTQQPYFYPHQQVPQYLAPQQMPPHFNYYSNNPMYMQPQQNYYTPQAFSYIPPPPSNFTTFLPTQQSSASRLLHHQQLIQPLPYKMNGNSKYFTQLEVSTSSPTLLNLPRIDELRNDSNNGICRSNSSATLNSNTSSSHTISSNPALASGSMPSTASIASSLNTLAATLGLCDRFSPSSSSSASTDSGFAEITSFPPSPDSVCSNQGKTSAFSQPQSSSTQSLLMLSGTSTQAPLNFSHMRSQKSGSQNFATSVKNMPLQLPILQNPSKLYGSAAIENCDAPASKVRKINSQEESLELVPTVLKDVTKPIEMLEPIEDKKSADITILQSLKMEQDDQSETAIELEKPLKELSVPLPEPEPRIEESCNPSTSTALTMPTEDYRGQFACGWATCQACLATDNELFDHVVKDHLEKLRPVVVPADEQKTPQASSTSTRLSRRRHSSNANSAGSTQKGKNNKEKEKEDKFRCNWKDCEMFLQRGDNQKQFDWLLDHYTTRHALAPSLLCACLLSVL